VEEGGQGQGKELLLNLVKGLKVVEGKEEGKLQVVRGRSMLEVGGGLDVSEWVSGFEGETEVLEKDVEGLDVSRGSVGRDASMESGKEDDMFSFLGCIEEGKKDEEAEKRREEERKRKRGVDMRINNRGLLGTPGWEEREKKEKGEERWSRTLEEGEIVWQEEMVLPAEYRLGMEKRGEQLNNSSRLRNGFGLNRNALFQKAGRERGEDKNWIATFTKAGCISCRNEEGVINHKGRKGEPLVLIIGDEATPMGVGYTKGPEEETGCCWVFKKEHLRLSEVPGILRRLNQEKVESDREAGRNPHQFFLPNGSKVLVGSFVNLRKEGLEGYVEEFASMVRDIWKVTGDVGIEVLPFVPVVFDNLDVEGGMLLSGVRNWIRWLSDVTGSVELRKLSETGGREEAIEEEPTTVFYKPVGVVLRSQVKESKELGNRGNMVSVVKSERRELKLRRALPAKEIMRLTNNGETRELGRRRGRKRRGGEVLGTGCPWRVSMPLPRRWRVFVRRV